MPAAGSDSSRTNSATCSRSTTAEAMDARRSLRRPAPLVAALGVLALLLLRARCSSAATRAPHADAPATREPGSQTLRRCATGPLAYCGSLPVPLDYGSPA